MYFHVVVGSWGRDNAMGDKGYQENDEEYSWAGELDVL